MPNVHEGAPLRRRGGGIMKYHVQFKLNIILESELSELEIWEAAALVGVGLVRETIAPEWDRPTVEVNVFKLDEEHEEQDGRLNWMEHNDREAMPELDEPHEPCSCEPISWEDKPDWVPYICPPCRKADQ